MYNSQDNNNELINESSIIENNQRVKQCRYNFDKR